MVGFGFGDAVIMELVKDKGLLPESLKSGNVDDLVYPHERGARACGDGHRREVEGGRANGGSGHRGWEAEKWAFKHAERCGASRVVLIGEKEWSKGLFG